ncbi:MAG: D-alanyl-D-alanine carboxypeptidase [Gammaproteobacteria bacterium]|nr:MAG: D-alanyl-D-alanine carboxypeptidase [Gammaproteobacteria bacterium]
MIFVRAGLFGLLLAFSLFAHAVEAPPAVGAAAWLLVDHDSGAVLAEHNANSPRAPASLTKLMVVYLAFERLRDGKLKLDERVRVSERAWATNGARLFLRPGTTITVEELLKGMIVRSANDATLALTEHLGGDEKQFVALMNEKARILGLTHTRFTNVTGLDREGHVSTARDLALLAGRLMRDFPDRYAWFALKEFAWGDVRQYNHNALLWRNDAVDGVKTGQTKSAGWCVIASAKRDTMRLTATVLGAKDETARFDAAQRLLDWGFRQFETRLLYAAEVPATKVRVWLGNESVLPLGVAQNLYLTLPRGDHERLRARLTVHDRQTAPIARGQKVGTLTLELNGKPYTEYPLVAMKDIRAGNALQRAWDELRLWLQ